MHRVQSKLAHDQQHRSIEMKMKAISEKVELLRWSAHYMGWPFTVLRVFVKASSKLGTAGLQSATFQRLSEQQFDRRFNVQTSGLVMPDELRIPQDRLQHAVEYAPTCASRFGWLLSKLPIDASQYVFVDIGSGKGRVLLMASEFPFKRVCGVELAHELHDISVQNIRRFRSQRRQSKLVQSFNHDATEFSFPDDPLVLFFFNPFSADILQIVVENLESSIRNNPRHVIVLYHNALYANVFEESPLFQKLMLHVEPGVDWKIYTTTASASHPDG